MKQSSPVAIGERLSTDEENTAFLAVKERDRQELREWLKTRDNGWMLGLRGSDRPTHTTCEPDLRII